MSVIVWKQKDRPKFKGINYWEFEVRFMQLFEYCFPHSESKAKTKNVSVGNKSRIFKVKPQQCQYYECRWVETFEELTDFWLYLQNFYLEWYIIQFLLLLKDFMISSTWRHSRSGTRYCSQICQKVGTKVRSLPYSCFAVRILADNIVAYNNLLIQILFWHPVYVTPESELLSIAWYA